MDNKLSEEFLKEHGIKSIKTIGIYRSGISLIVEFNNGDIERRYVKRDIIKNMIILMDIINIRSRKKKLLKIMSELKL